MNKEEKTPNPHQINQVAISVLAAGLIGMGNLLYTLNNQVIALTHSITSLTKEVARLQAVSDVNTERIRSIEIDITRTKP
jgi:hypothetical protein